MKDNIILIGFMGAGKTSIGTGLSDRRKCQLIDTDWLIEQEAGMSIPAIFETQGEDGFRRIESGILEKLKVEANHLIISVGGGLPLREANRKALSELGMVVFLRTRPRTVLKRLAGDTTRPLLQVANKQEKVEQLLAERNPIYAQAAHLVIDVDDKTPEQIIDELELLLESKDFAKGDKVV